MKTITVKDILDASPDEVEIAIGDEAQRKLKIPKTNIDAIRRLMSIGARVWVRVPFRPSVALDASYSFILANIDAILYPDTICNIIGCDVPAEEPELIIVKYDGRATLLVNCSSPKNKEIYTRILKFLAETGPSDVKVIENGEVYVPITELNELEKIN